MTIFVMLLMVAIAISRNSFMKSTAIPKDDKSPGKGNSTSDSEVVTIKDKSYQPESNMDSSLL